VEEGDGEIKRIGRGMKRKKEGREGVNKKRRRERRR